MEIEAINTVENKTILFRDLIIGEVSVNSPPPRQQLSQQPQTSGSSSSSEINFIGVVIPKSSSGHSSSTESSSSATTTTATTTSSSLKPDQASPQAKTKSQSPSSCNHQQQNGSTRQPAFILNAFVNGFVQLKLCADKIDYAYIIEIYWSNETKSFIKRTFNDFVEFHARLEAEFRELFQKEKPATDTHATSSLSSSKKRSSLIMTTSLSPPSIRKKMNDSKGKFFNFAHHHSSKSIDDLLPVLPGFSLNTNSP